MHEMLRFMPNVQLSKKFTASQYIQLNTIAEENSCDYIMMYETVKERDPYLWVSQSPNGPTVCFHLETMHSVDDCHFNGICTHRSSPILLFDPEFDKTPEMAICKHLLRKALQVPFGTRGMKDIVDTALSFFLLDGRIWFRRYQIEYGEKMNLCESGPRFCLNPAAILSGSFCGRKVWKNPKFVAPHKARKAPILSKPQQSK